MTTSYKINIATAIALIFHAVGLIGMLFFKSGMIINSTPIHLILMALLIIFTQQRPNRFFLLFFVLCFIGGYLAEYIGIHTGLLFGDYKYGNVLGPKLLEVPPLIGINWFIIMYTCGSCMYMLLDTLRKRATARSVPGTLKTMSLVIDGAMLAVFMDWLIEPVAIKLGYWQWLGSGDIPVFNYVSWFVVSVFFLLFFHLMRFDKHNKFALNLLLIQAMFFLILRTFL